MPYLAFLILQVVNTGGVTKAILALEKMTLTKEALEGTRLGRLVNDIRKASTDDKLRERCRRLIQKWKNQFVGSIKSKPADGRGSPTTSQLKQKSASKSSPKAGSLISQTPVTTGGTPVDQTKSENRKRRKPDSATSSPEDKRPPKKQQIVDSAKQKTKEHSAKDGIKRREDSVTDQTDSCPPKVVIGKAGKTRSSKVKSNDGNKETKSLHKLVVVSNATKAVGIVEKKQSQNQPKTSQSKKSPKGARHGINSGSSSSSSKRNGSAGDSLPSQSLRYEETNQTSVLSPHRVIAASPESVSYDENTQDSYDESGEVSLFDMDKEEEDEERQDTLDELTMSSMPDSPITSQDSGSSQHSHGSNQMSDIVDDTTRVAEELVEEEGPPVRSREVKVEDVNRLHDEHWEGMNGNFNSDGGWSSWDSCFSVRHGWREQSSYTTICMHRLTIATQ
ncbi:putative mediator of RNA polymerase II transcription subunit 26 isoform X1 [Apostichopus japonicus]|uniref:Mediator of RNA polymerase II transcription subunit 26 n=1 Tax=Stichopus japonicus TaxID=307972 RepID=A0A2G8JUW8_STIJA|nr:putative mediator of RNA polymerase II transcription subunit 26 isoform X1 [Apostichopus japonicus]